jgi:hypothetical protein
LATLHQQHAKLAEGFTTSAFGVAIGRPSPLARNGEAVRSLVPHLPTTSVPDVVMAAAATEFRTLGSVLLNPVA